MNTLTPCAEWEEKLAARHPEDLSATERATLQKHIATCAACAEAYSDYDFLTACIRALPQPTLQPLPHVSFTLQKREEEAEEHGKIIEFPVSKKIKGTAAPRYPRFTHAMNVAVAMLAVAAIIVSALFLFKPHQETSVSGTRQTTSLPQSKVVGGYTVTIVRAYADINEAIIGFTVKDGQHHIVDEQHVWLVPRQLITGQGLNLPGDGTAGGFDGNEFFNMQSVAFDTSAIPVDTRILSLHLTVALGLQPTPPLTPPAYASVPVPQIGQTSFDFSIPFNTGRAVTMHQIMTVHGVSLTLERVTVSRSEIRITLYCPKASLAFVQNVGNSTFYLSVGNQHALEPNLSELADPIVLHFRYPLSNYHGVWTLQFRVTTPAKNAGTLTFHFVVPG